MNDEDLPIEVVVAQEIADRILATNMNTYEPESVQALRIIDSYIREFSE